MGFLSAAYRILHPTYRSIRSSGVVVKLFFDVKVPPNLIIHWDTTTLLLKKALQKTIHAGQIVLEMGIGQGALLSIWVARHLQPARMDGVDVSVSRVESAARVVRHNGAEVSTWTSDLFSAVEGKYDVIFFNPPYVRTAVGRELRLTERLAADGDQVWDGGELGTEVVFKFLKTARSHLAPGGKVLIGVQNYYVKDFQIRKIADQFGYQVIARHTAMLNPSVVYALNLNRSD